MAHCKQSSITPLSDSLSNSGAFVDNEFRDSIQRLKLFDIFRDCGVRRKFGASLTQVVFVLLLIPLLNVDSMHCFCGKFLSCFHIGAKDVLYRFVNRQDIPWNRISLKLAVGFFQAHKALITAEIHALVVDDTLKPRRGKVEGGSSHWDHNAKQAIFGQQVLQLGLAYTKGFLPLLSKFYTGEKKVVARKKPFENNRSAVASDYRESIESTKHQMLAKMVKKVLRFGIRATYLLGDAWFGTKDNIRLALDNGLIGIFLMKRGKLKYRFQGRMYCAKQLHELVKRRMQRVRGQRFRAYKIQAEINIGTKKEPQWISISLIFSQSIGNRSDKGWVLVLCMDTSMSIEKIIEVYALRWSIEVFFKEAKQNLGFLDFQSSDFVGNYASVNLAAMRYTLLMDAALSNGGSFGANRGAISRTLEYLSFAGVLWELFRAIIHGVLDQLTKRFGSQAIRELKNAIGYAIEDFLERALHFDAESVEALLVAENQGVL